MQSRRGFLQTIMSAVGLAAFDPISKLWVPQKERVVGITLQAAEGQTLAEAVQKVTDEQLELNNLAFRVARRLGEHLERFQAIGLQAVEYRFVQHVQNVGPLIDIDGESRLFLPNARHMEAVPLGEASVDQLARQLAFRAQISNTQVFAPITTELSPGSKFDDEMQIGIGVDPDTGVSIRLLKWMQEGAGTYRTAVLLTDTIQQPGDYNRPFLVPERLSHGKWFMGVETCGGRWETKTETKARYEEERLAEHRRTHDWDGHKRSPEEQARYEQFVREDRAEEYNPDDFSR